MHSTKYTAQIHFNSFWLVGFRFGVVFFFFGQTVCAEIRITQNIAMLISTLKKLTSV